MKKHKQKVVLFILCSVFIFNANAIENVYSEYINAPELLDEKEVEESMVLESIPEEVSNWLEGEMLTATSKPLESFNTPSFFKQENAKLIGYIKGYDKSLGFKTGMFYYTNNLTRESSPIVLEIHEDGRFEMELPLHYPIYNRLLIHNKFIPFYLEPGQVISVVLDWKDFHNVDRYRNVYAENISYQGALAKTNTELLNFKPNDPNYRVYEKLKTAYPEVIKKEQLLLKKKDLEKIEAYRLNGSIEYKTAVLLKNYIELTTASNIFNYFSLREWRQFPNIPKEMLEIEVPENYYDFLTEIQLNNQSYLAMNEFSGFVNRLESSKLLKVHEEPVSVTFDSFKGFLTFLNDKNIVVSKNEEEIIRQLITKNESGEMKGKPSSFSKEFSDKYDDLINEFMHLKLDSMRNEKYLKIKEKTWNEKNLKIAKFGNKNDLVYEIIKSRTLKFIIESTNAETASSYWEEMKKGIESPYLKQVGDNLLKHKMAKGESYELPIDEKGTDIIKEIIEPYKGKYIVLSFWEHFDLYLKHTKEIRKKYRDNNADLEFVFINLEGDPKVEKYLKIIKEQEVENSIRLTTDKWHYIRQLFKVNNSTWHVLIDKNGNVLNDNFPIHNVEPEMARLF